MSKEFPIISRKLIEQKSVKADCPECARKQNCQVETGILEHLDYGQVDAWNRHLLLRCEGCDEVFYGVYRTFSEDIDYVKNPYTGDVEEILTENVTFFPKAQYRTAPRWQTTLFGIAHSELDTLLGEIRTVFNDGHLSFAAMGIRTAFEIAADELKIEKEISFSEKIEKLRSKGHISAREKNVLENLIDAGSAVIHRGWHPSSAEVETMLDALEQFIQRAIVLPEDLDRIAEKVPKKQTNAK